MGSLSELTRKAFDQASACTFSTFKTIDKGICIVKFGIKHGVRSGLKKKHPFEKSGYNTLQPQTKRNAMPKRIGVCAQQRSGARLHPTINI